MKYYKKKMTLTDKRVKLNKISQRKQYTQTYAMCDHFSIVRSSEMSTLHDHPLVNGVVKRGKII